MIDLLLRHASGPAAERDLVRDLMAHEAALIAGGGAGDRSQVGLLENAVKADPQDSFSFDLRGYATLRAAGRSLDAGRFETRSIRELREKATSGLPGRESRARVRLFVLEGNTPATDIGGLQATAGPGTLFQVASQFNCLESTGPHLTRISSYFHDSTQGPRASISAFPGALLRHYSAPDRDGKRFVQSVDRQLELLEAVCGPGLAKVQNGYLTAADITDPAAFAAALASGFEDIRVGVHDHVEVVLGYDWDGAVPGAPRIGQVFTSTFAGGGYSHIRSGDETYWPICAVLLRASYLATLLAAGALGRPKVLLTLIGGGAFDNPIPLIWDSILWAIEQVEHRGANVTDVIVNGRTLAAHLSTKVILSQVRPRGGAVVRFDSGTVSVQR